MIVVCQVGAAGEAEEEQGRAAPGFDERSAGDLQTKLAYQKEKVGLPLAVSDNNKH